MQFCDAHHETVFFSRLKAYMPSAASRLGQSRNQLKLRWSASCSGQQNGGKDGRTGTHHLAYCRCHRRSLPRLGGGSLLLPPAVGDVRKRRNRTRRGALQRTSPSCPSYCVVSRMRQHRQTLDFCRTGPVKVSVENRWNSSGKHSGRAKNKHGVVCIWSRAEERGTCQPVYMALCFRSFRAILSGAIFLVHTRS